MKHGYTIFGAALACLIALAAVSPATAYTNLLANPGFESAGGSYSGWFTFGPNVLLSTPGGDNIIRNGVAAAKIYGGFPMCPVPSFNVSGCGQAFTPTAGAVYEFRGYSYVSSADPIPGANTCSNNRLIAKIVFFNAAVGGAEIASNEVVLGDFDTALNQWIEFKISAPAPAAAQRVEALLLYLQPGCDGGAVFVDDLMFGVLPPLATTPNVLANPSFNGSLTGWTTFGNAWYDGRSWAARTPSGSAKMFSTFNPGFDSGMYQEFAATAGSVWEFDLHAMTTCMETPIQAPNGNIVVARIAFLDVSHLEITFAESVVLDQSTSVGTWKKHAVIGTAPAGTSYVRAYVLFVSPNSDGGSAWIDDTYFGGLAPTPVGDTPRPMALSVRPNVPNPFGQSTRIDFDLDGADHVDVGVYDVAGRRVATLSSGRRGAGPQSVTWDGRTSGGAEAPSGVYWCVLRTSRDQKALRLVLLR